MSNPFKLISTRKIYENPWISLREDSVIRPGGKEGIFGVVSMKDGCTILALDKDGDIFITNEFHYGIGANSIELVSGGMDADEDPLDCAKRELEEESGYTAKEWIYLGYIDPFTTVVHSKNHIFLARDLVKTRENPDAGEIVNLSKIPYGEALEMAMQSKVTHGASVVAILKAQKYIEHAS